MAASILNYQQTYPHIPWISFGEMQRGFFDGVGENLKSIIGRLSHRKHAGSDGAFLRRLGETDTIGSATDSSSFFLRPPETGNGLLSNPTTAAQPWRLEPLFLPQTRHSLGTRFALGQTTV
jgi:hypothetical protein